MIKASVSSDCVDLRWGGSALLPAPPAGFDRADEIALNEELLASGAPISAVNVVRKHFSVIKGRRLAALTKARVVSFVVSDIPEDDPALVSAGPTILNRGNQQDVMEIIARYRLKLPQRTFDFIGFDAARAQNAAEERLPRTATTSCLKPGYRSKGSSVCPRVRRYSRFAVGWR